MHGRDMMVERRERERERERRDGMIKREREER